MPRTRSYGSANGLVIRAMITRHRLYYYHGNRETLSTQYHDARIVKGSFGFTRVYWAVVVLFWLYHGFSTVSSWLSWAIASYRCFLHGFITVSTILHDRGFITGLPRFIVLQNRGKVIVQSWYMVTSWETRGKTMTKAQLKPRRTNSVDFYFSNVCVVLNKIFPSRLLQPNSRVSCKTWPIDQQATTHWERLSNRKQ